MNVWKRKLNSEQGASITMALLIFLICTVVGSAVLVAGTAASGRMSKAAEYDQRYYAVNSAVRLLRDMIEGQKIKVVKNSTGYSLYDMSAAENGSGTGGSGETGGTGGSGETGGTGGTSGTEESGVLIDPSQYNSSFTTEAAFRIVCQSSTLPFPRHMELTATADALGDSVDVTIDETIKPDGSMVFLVTKETDSNPYAVEITFAMDKDEQSVITGTADGSQTETVTTTLQWKLSDIKTVENKAGIVNDDG